MTGIALFRSMLPLRTIIPTRAALPMFFPVVLAAATPALSARPVSAQTAEACGCASQLDALAHATQQNYAGYQDKASTTADRLALDRHLSLLRARAVRTLGADCLDLLKAYIHFFRDHHLQVRSTAPAGRESLRLSRTSVLNVDSLSRVPITYSDPILGMWESTSGRTRLVIVPAPPPYGQYDRYAAVMSSADTAWSAGDLYATFVSAADEGIYHATWFSPTRAPQEWAAVVVDDSLLLTGFNGWHRVTTDRPGAPAGRRDPLRPSFRSLSRGIALLTLPSMQVQYAADVDSVVRTHAAELGRLDLLVIDVRGNQGGGDNTYMPILPLLFTDTITTVAGSVLSSPANIAYYERFLDPAGVNSPTWVVEMLADMRAQPGAQIALPPSTLAYDDVRPYPRAIAILLDGVAASSTETFLLKARQSSKVRLFGQPSAGIVDYLNPAHHPLGCGVVLQAPTIRRSLRLPADAIDNIGIAPDVLLPWNEPDPITTVTTSYRQ
jgi:hypothetical protein